MRTIAVVGLLPGTGVPAILNCLIEYANTAAAIATSNPPTGSRSTWGTKGRGQATVSTAPERSEARTTSGGRTTGLATLAVVASRGCWLAELICDNLGVIVNIDNLGVNRRSQRRGAQWEATVRQTKAAGRIVSSKGETIADLMLEVAQFFFRIRAVGQKTGLITSWGGGAFGFMRSLALIGPLTVPQIAQMRPTSRQRMQRLADELAAEGLVEFIDNPRHRRSKLVRLTRKGDARFRELSARFLAIASTMGADLSETDIRKTTEIVRRLSDETKGAQSSCHGA